MDKYSYVLQISLLEEANLKEIEKSSKILLKELKKVTRNSSLEIYILLSEKRFVPLSNLKTIKPEMQKELLNFYNKMESFFILFFHTSKMLWFANFRDVSKKIDFTAYGTYPKQKPGVWMSYSEGNYDEGIAFDPISQSDGNYKDYNLSNNYAKKRKLQWIMNVLELKEDLILKTLKK